jgi:intracellular septation protein
MVEQGGVGLCRPPIKKVVAMEATNWRQRHYPFNAEQTVNILGEIGPLFAMFLVNGVYGIAAGTWALIGCTIASLIATLWVLGRPPIMPFIAGAVSVTFGALTLITGDAMWVQVKVTIFNTLVALLLWLGLRSGHNFFRFVFGKTFHNTEEGWEKLTRNVALFFTPTSTGSTASSPAWTSGYSSRFSSSCRSRASSSGGKCACCSAIGCPSPSPRSYPAVTRSVDGPRMRTG